MQLSNMELNSRVSEVCEAHGISQDLIPLFLKPYLLECQLLESQEHQNSKAATINVDPNTQARLQIAYLADCFEVSPQWLSFASETIIDKIPDTYPATSQEQDYPLIAFIQYLIKSKHLGLKPKIVLIKSLTEEKPVLQTEIKNPEALVFIELSKMTKSGIAYTVYKEWSAVLVQNTLMWKYLLLPCLEANIFIQGLMVEESTFAALREKKILPVIGIKAAKGLWFPAEKAQDKSIEANIAQFILKIQTLLEELKYVAIQPTVLN